MHKIPPLLNLLGDRFKDSVHPNDTGYRLMAETWYAKISGVLR